MPILTNKAKCMRCGDIIESKFRHDFVECSCGSIFVDGGKDYLRRGYLEKGEDCFIELSEFMEEEDEKN